jgi:hypothetical protein
MQLVHESLVSSSELHLNEAIVIGRLADVVNWVQRVLDGETS